MRIIKVRCDSCDLLNEVDCSHLNKERTYLKIKYSICIHCGHPRTNEKPGPGQFQCTLCRFIYTITKKRYPIDGKCTACYVSLWRKKRFNTQEPV